MKLHLTKGQARGYSSHFPVLFRALSVTAGDVLELGTGLFSTPALHWLCAPTERRLVSYESDPAYYDLARQYQTAWHTVTPVTDWDALPLERPWDVVLVDHAPDARRVVDIRRLAPWARYLVVHDSDAPRYGYADVLPLFRSRYEYTGARPRTLVLSALLDVRPAMHWEAPCLA